MTKFKDNVDLVCCLSGEPILRSKDITKEHYCPKSRVPKCIWEQKYNIKPAIKIFNNIKGNLLPCEWEWRKIDSVSYALNNFKLDNFERNLLEKVLKKYEMQGPQYVCNVCILYKLMKCNGM